MSLLLWIFILIVIYVVTFNNDFDKEVIDKTLPFIVVIGLIVLLFSIISAA